MPATTPAAAIQNGRRNPQRHVIATLATWRSRARRRTGQPVADRDRRSRRRHCRARPKSRARGTALRTASNYRRRRVMAAPAAIGAKMKLVMVGNGMAGVRTLEELLKIAPELYDITVFGAEPHPNYNRILLSPVLAGEQTLDEIMLNPLRLVRASNGITLHARQEGRRDRPRRAASCVADDGTERRIRPAAAVRPAPTRSSCRCPARSCDGVIAYRDIADTNAMIEAAREVQARGRDRRRPAGPGGGQRPDAARHGRHRGAPDALADGAPARRRRRQAAAEVARGRAA